MANGFGLGASICGSHELGPSPVTLARPCSPGAVPRCVFAHLGGCTGLLFAAGRLLQMRQPDPGGEVSKVGDINALLFTR